MLRHRRLYLGSLTHGGYQCGYSRSLLDSLCLLYSEMELSSLSIPTTTIEKLLRQPRVTAKSKGLEPRDHPVHKVRGGEK